jgi:glycosyltransferase involved in cell wall biosynthesis
MRILFLNWKDPLHREAGGAERYVKHVAELWAAQGHSVAMLVPRVPGRPDREVMAQVAYIRMGFRLTVFRKARRFLRRHGQDWDLVVEAVSTRPFFAHRIKGVRASALYMQIADDVWHREFAPPLAWLGRRVIEPLWLRRMRNAHVVAISPSTAQDLRRHHVPVVAWVPPGTAMQRQRRTAVHGVAEPRLIFLGRLCHSKRPLEALAAFNLIRETHPTARLDIVGDGYLASSLREKAGPGVHVHGRVDEATKVALLDQAHVMLLPATREGFGIVAIEAAARGLPVVAYDIPGFRDAIVDGTTGVLVAPRPSALADASLALLRDEGRWIEMSLAAYSGSVDLTWESTASRLLAAVSSSAGALPTATPRRSARAPRSGRTIAVGVPAMGGDLGANGAGELPQDQ